MLTFHNTHVIVVEFVKPWFSMIIEDQNSFDHSEMVNFI